MILRASLRVLDRLEETMIATLMGVATLVIFMAGRIQVWKETPEPFSA